MRTISLVNAVLALSLLGIVAAELGHFSWLSIELQRAIGVTLFVANAAFGIYGILNSHRIAWSAYLALSIAGALFVGASTPIVALWLMLKLL